MKITLSKASQSSLLGSKRYGLFWVSSFLSNIGTWMQQVAQPWVMLAISHSSFMVGLDSFTMNAPGWILTLWGGALADRMDRKKIIIVFQGIQFLAILSLVFLFYFGWLNPWILILISFVVGVTDSLSMPSFQSIIPSLVSKEEIPKAVTLNSIQFNLSRTLGPAIAGLVMAQFGALACFSGNALSYLPFFLSIVWIYPSKIKERAFNTDRDQVLTAFQTARAVFKNNEVSSPLAATFITTLFCSPLITFCPVLIKEVFNGEIREFGFASTAFGLGGLAAAIVAFLYSKKFKLYSPSVLGASAGMVVLITSFNHSPAALMGLLVLGGAFLTLANTSTNSNIQTLATEHVRGRYASLYQLAFRSGLSLGALLTGVMSSRLGMGVAFGINGALAIALHLLLFCYSKPMPSKGKKLN